MAIYSRYETKLNPQKNNSILLHMVILSTNTITKKYEYITGI